MDKRLEKIGILCTSMAECKQAIGFLVNNGVSNQYGMTGTIPDCNINNNRVYYVLNGVILCGVKSTHTNGEPGLRDDITIMTIPQIKKMLSSESKIELTFPKRMLVSKTNRDFDFSDRLVLFKKDEFFVGVIPPGEETYNNPNSMENITLCFWPFAKELPTQKEINQEKIEELQRDLTKLLEQQFTLEEQINKLKQQNCE